MLQLKDNVYCYCLSVYAFHVASCAAYCLHCNSQLGQTFSESRGDLTVDYMTPDQTNDKEDSGWDWKNWGKLEGWDGLAWLGWGSVGNVIPAQSLRTSQEGGRRGSTGRQMTPTDKHVGRIPFRVGGVCVPSYGSKLCPDLQTHCTMDPRI